ncbi:SDR family NAD(P)-dependent oxidoreductase [Allokutzneria sp. A3M-2-11 16]|uniref:type I polyketide synthase n=1 Tax=Allokutzneria sp. A3M-2-11 16 TaxID=2962043 RepID=UPI0020B7517D|nr:type I polyketide synthase [Allokutzneria sp. A3M-2-11 16]MCP3805304.1 SDR family NAD(P)-dependent oxidoreductase [Allokutzneria sp. A3M-2-11 16]
MTSTPEIGAWLTQRVAVAAGIDPDSVDPAVAFDAYGLTSTEAVSVAGELEEWLEVELAPTLLYRYPTIAKLAAFLGGQEDSAPEALVAGDDENDPVCVVGMGCRFPGGSNSPESFWRNLLDGRDAVSEVPADRWDADAHYSADPGAPGKSYTKLGGFVDDLAGFDASFFDIPPREALRMDPEHRLLIEVAWEAIEDAGIPVDRLRGKQVGVYVGKLASSQYESVQLDAEGADCLDDPYLGLGSAASVAAGRLAYLLDLRGPAVVVDTACSSSLVAVHMAVRGVLAGECELAVVGGVSATVHPESVRQACKMHMLARDGRCKTFDAAADGFRMGEGCGVVVLERLSRARANGHRVLAVLRGSAVNQDGASNGLTAPNGGAQVAVIGEALSRAGVAPDSVGYVEAHGSGTLLGDSIEMQSIQSVFGSRAQSLVVGAVKTNIGHLLGAAGIAGLIKAVFAVHEGVVPPNLHLAERNPTISWDRCPVELPEAPMYWPEIEGPRRAGVSSFGWSGTNAHVVVEQPPSTVDTSEDAGPHLLLLSAATPSALGEAADRMREHLHERKELDLSDVAFTTQTGRQAMDCRAAVVSPDRAHALGELRRIAARPPADRVRRGGATPVSFLLPGTGDHYPGMGFGLYESEPAFRDAVDECVGLLEGPLREQVRSMVTAPAQRSGFFGASRQPTESLDVAHAAVFTVDYACAKLWQHWGVTPTALLGYSLGEYVAACLAGVFSLADALRLVVCRAKIIQAAPTGVMLAVALPEDQVRPRLGGLSLAAVNGPHTSVVSGPADLVAALEERLAREDVACRRVPTSHAMHSAMLEPLRDKVIELLASVKPGALRIPFISNVTGTWITEEQAGDPRYWANHMCQTVRFAPGLEELREGVLLEAGPGQLSSLATQILGANRGARMLCVPTLRPAFDDGSDREFLLRTAGRMWSRGVEIDWRAVHRGTRALVPLPTYPFEHVRFWPEGTGKVVRASQPDKLPSRDDWCHVPVWTQIPALPGGRQHTWLVLADESGPAAELAERLRTDGAAVTVVRQGEQLDSTGCTRVVYGWNTGFRGLLDVVRALGRTVSEPVGVFALTSGAFEVVGGDGTTPEEAVLAGVCRTVEPEFPALTCRVIDLPETGALESLLAELHASNPADCVAYRNGTRWVRDWSKLPIGPADGPWRQGGSYLITGGLGGLGFGLARQLAPYKPRLTLLGRSARPDDERVRELESLGAEVLVLQCDVADVAALEAAVGQVRERFGELHGVVHTAGVPASGLIQLTEWSDAERVLRPKVAGTLALHEVLRDAPLDFLVLYSSSVVAMGGLGESDYSAANSFLGSFAQQARRRGFPATAVDWGPWRHDSWQSERLASAPDLRLHMRELRDRHGITEEEGFDLLTRVLASGLPEVMVVPRDLAELTEEWATVTGSGEAAPVLQSFPRPALRSPFVAPRTPLERQITEVWQRYLGVDEVGVDDAFFDLGGNSLIGLTIVGAIKKEVGAPLTAADLFEAPTPATLAALLARRLEGEAEPEVDASRGERRRQMAAAGRRRRR